MNLSEIKTKLNKLLDSDTCIIFENVEMTGEIVEFLFSNENIKKVYFIRYENSTFQKIKDVITNKEIVLIDFITKEVIANSTIIYCLDRGNYFNSNYSIIAKDKNLKGLCFFGFPESPFTIKPSSKDLLITSYKFIDLIQTKVSASLASVEIETKSSRICHNRGDEKIKLEQFLASSQERLLIVHGFPGYGKNNLLDELIRKAPNRKYIYFNFQDSLDTYKDIINELSPYISFSFQHDELQNTNISTYGQSHLVNSFIKKISEKENITLVFDATEKVLQQNGAFLSDELNKFFERLITDNNYNSSNKIIFLSRIPFIGNHQIRDFKTEINIGELLPFYVKRIMADEYNRLNKPELALKIAKYSDDEIIDKAICGHPALALRFVDASFRHGVDELLNNSEFTNKIGIKIKIDWLLENYPLTEPEKKMLEIIGLFSGEVPKDYLNTHFPDSYLIVEQLIARYLLDAKIMKDGSVKYYVPKIIQDYIIGITSNEIISKNHLELGNYFWDKAEDITAASFQKVSSYRKAFHHYNLSGDKEKIKLLVMRFKEKFLLEAWENSRDRKWEEAFFFFNELHINNQIGLANARDYNEFLKVISRLKNKPKNADSLFEEVHSLFLNDSFIAVTFADYLFKKGLYQQSIDECVRIKKLGRDSDSRRRADPLSETIIDNTLAKCYFKIGNPAEAEDIISKWKDFFYRKGISNLSKNENYHLQSLIMTQYAGQDDFEVYRDSKNSIISKLETANLKVKEIPFLQYNLRNTYCVEGEQQKKIEEQFQKTFDTLKGRTDQKLQTSYDNFHQNIISNQKLGNYIAQINQVDSNLPININSELKSINELITKGYSLIKEIHNIDANHFQSNYSLASLMQVEADFYLVKETLKNFNL
jgi:antibiotic biosynthesis monooxygenase (ABM) superfamily enzyme